MRQKTGRATLLLLCALCLTLALMSDYEAKAGPGVIDNYATNVTDKVKRNLQIPPEWRRHRYEATARVDIDKLGRITGASITAPSGNPGFDTAVLAAIRKTGSFGPPPFELYAVGLRVSSRM